MKKILFILMIITCLFSCHDQEKKPVNDLPVPSPQTENKTTTKEECYEKIAGRDTVKMHLTISGTIVTGDLMYNYFEKDKNTGTLQGTLVGDTLIADYTFKAEGTISVREVAFLRSGNTFMEGYGESVDKNEKMAFADRKNLKFTDAIVLKKVECEK